MDKKIKLALFITFLFLILFGIFVFLFFRTKMGSNSLVEQKQVPPTYTNLPINKGVLVGRTGVFYEIEGVFSDTLSLKYGFLEGKFVIEDDPLGRNIEVFAGNTGKNLYLGTYESSFEGKSVWKLIPTDLASQVIKPGRPVNLRITLSYENSQRNEYTRNIEIVLDTIIAEFTNQNFEYKIPSDFILTPERIGIIK